MPIQWGGNFWGGVHRNQVPSGYVRTYVDAHEQSMGSPLSNSTGAQAGAPEPTGPQVDLFIDVAIYGLTSPDGPVGFGRGERRGIPYTYVHM